MAEERRRGFSWRGLVLLLTGAGAVVGAALMAKSWAGGRDLREHGALVEAHLEGKEVKSGRGGVSYLVRYRFETPGGRTFRGTSGVDSAHRREWERAGPTLAVRYLPTDPSVSAWAVGLQDDGMVLAVGAALVGLIGLMLLVAGAAAFFMTRERHERWLRSGRP